MLNKCANPQCDAVFRYLSVGRLFQVATSDGNGQAKTQQPPEYYWLCPTCALRFTIARDGDGRVSVVQQTPGPEQRAA
jgi:hypothetical protein